MRFLRASAVAAATSSILTAASAAQSYPASQRTTVSQMVAFTEVSLEYGRPVARGRTLFGSLVPWDAIWHPGADSASRIAFSKDVVIEGKEVVAGEYSFWLIPREDKPWTLILSRKAHVWHRNYPGEAEDALRLEIVPEPLSHMETFAIYFPVVNGEEAVLRLHWGELAISAKIIAPGR